MAGTTPDDITTAEREEGNRLLPRFDERGLVAAVATHAETGEVLMLAYMNAEALARTIETGEAHYWSRSRAEIWHKGATSGHVQTVVELRVDCDQDAVWLKVLPHGPGQCHVGYPGCFYRRAPLGQPAGEPVRLETVEAKAYDPKAVYGH